MTAGRGIIKKNMKENIGIYGIKDIDIHSLIQDTIKEVNTSTSLLCDTLVEEAERNTSTLEEYKAFMKGAAFVFRCVAKRNEPNKYGTPQTISTIQSAITHCIKLLPFMEEIEKQEHLKLIGWLNELLISKGEKVVTIPKQYK